MIRARWHLRSSIKNDDRKSKQKTEGNWK